MSYILPNEAMELLQITTRQGLHKVVVNHNITVKSQGAGKPNLYLKSDLERYKKDNAKNIEKKKTKTVIEKAEKVKKEKVERKAKAKKLKVETKKELGIDEKKSNENWTVTTGKENVKKVIDELCNKNKKPKKQTQPKKELNIISEDDPIDNLFDDEDIIKPKNEDLQNPLNEIGQNEFNRIIDILTENGTYKEQDRALVLAYSISYQKYIYAVAASAREDDTTSDQFSNLKIHPYFLVADKCLSQMTKIASILGIGIRSRLGIEIQQPKKESIFDILNSKESFD